jgi:hypothetical protein
LADPPPDSEKNHKKYNGETFVVASAVKPMSNPFSAVIGDVSFVCTPTCVPITCTEKLQEAPALRVAPDRLMRFDPGVAEIVPPPQEPTNPLLGRETARPEGRVSVKAMSVSRTPLAAGFVIEKPSVVLDPNRLICESANDFVIRGGSPEVMVAEAAFPVPALVEVTFDVMLV